MEKFQIDYGTLVSAYQSKLNEIVQQTIFSEAKAIILETKIKELEETLLSQEKKVEALELALTKAKKKSVEGKDINTSYG